MAFRYALIVFVGFVLVGFVLASGSQTKAEAARPPRSFELIDIYGVSAPTIREMTTSDVNGCLALCQSDLACKAFTFARTTKLCSLKGPGGQMILDPRLTAGLAKDQPLVESTNAFIMECHSGGWKGAQLSADRAQSAATCSDRCSAAADCILFAFEPQDNTCRLYSGFTAPTASPTGTAGLKRQKYDGETLADDALCPDGKVVDIKRELADAGYKRQRLADLQSRCSADPNCPSSVATEIANRVALAEAEETAYRQINGDPGALKEYLSNCKACEFADEARAAITQHEADDKPGDTPAAAAPNPGPSGPDTPQSAAPAPDAGPAPHAVAIAIGRLPHKKTGAWGIDNGATVDAAKQAAMTECAAHARDCQSAAFEGAGCIAAAASGQTWTVRGGPSREDAIKETLQACSERIIGCHLLTIQCNVN